MIACICGGFEFLLIIPALAWVWHKIKSKCCKNACACGCHEDNQEHPMAEAPVQGCYCRMCESARAAKQ